MEPENSQDLIRQFGEIAGVDQARSRFFLEAAGWELDNAMSSFFEGGHNVADEGDDDDAVMEHVQSLSRQFPQASQDEGTGFRRANAPRTGQPVTLDSLRQAVEDDSGEEDDRQGQAFYAGGSQSSGQQVLGPPKKRDEMVAEMFKKAREMGAEEVSAGEPSTRKKGNTFGGTGYKLGETSEDTVVVPSADRPAERGQREFVLRLWSRGFTINDGPLRDYHDPESMTFLDSIKRREIPQELRQAARGAEVDLRMEDHRQEDYVPPKVAARPFTGQGHTLGSPAPATVGSTGPASEADRKANEASAQSQINLADGEPTTNITFRLVDGSRVQARFNHTHTVEDLYRFVNAARPATSASNYVLTFFPNKELNDRNATVKDANVLNTMITQKMK